MKARILHKMWNILSVPRSLLNGKKRCVGVDEAVIGDCDPPDAKDKTIRIASDLTPIEQLEVVIHEALHAADWFKDEEWIRIVAHDIARLLWRLGWRLTEDGSLKRKKDA